MLSSPLPGARVTLEWCWHLSGLQAHCQACDTALNGLWPRVHWREQVHRMQGRMVVVGLVQVCCRRGPAASYNSCRGWWLGVGRSAEVWGWGAQRHQASWKVCSAGSCSCLCILAGRRGGKWHSRAPLFLEKCPKERCCCRTCSGMSKPVFLLYVPGFFNLLLPCFISVGLFLVQSAYRVHFLLSSWLSQS